MCSISLYINLSLFPLLTFRLCSRYKVPPNERGPRVPTAKPQLQPFGGVMPAVSQYVMPVVSTINCIM